MVKFARKPVMGEVKGMRGYRSLVEELEATGKLGLHLGSRM